MELAVFQTPLTLTFNDSDKRTIQDIGTVLMKEMNEHKIWTEECTLIMTSNPKLLFLYDRFEHSLGNAYGHPLYKIALNPMMVVCYHPDCQAR